MNEIVEGVDLNYLPANYDEEMARQAAEMSKRIAGPSGNKIRVTQNKVFQFPDGNSTTEPFDAVIIDFVSRNDYYERGYNPDDIVPPSCFAIGMEPSLLVPSKNAPEKQSDTCASCPQNQYDSGQRGGKACKNMRLLAVLPPDAQDDHPLWTLSVSPTALKFFDDYVRDVALKLQRAPLQVITKIGFDPNLDYPSLRFGQPRPNPLAPHMFARQAAARGILNTEPDYAAFAPAKPAPAKRGVRR